MVDVHKFKFKKSKESIIILFLIFPFYALPFILINMYKRQKWAFVLWAIFMGLIGILWPPTGDLYRYTEDYYLYKDLNFEDFIFLLGFKFDYFLSFITYSLGYFDLNFDLSRFLYNFIGYLLLGNLYLKIINKNPFLQTSKYLLLSLVIFMTFSISSYLFRFGLSSILFIYGAYKIVYEQNNGGLIYLLLAIFNHASFIILFIGFLFYKLGFFRFAQKTIVILIFIALFVDSEFVINFFYSLSLPIEIVNKYSDYLDGKWAGDYLTEKSWKYQLMHFVLNCFSYIYIIGYILLYKEGCDRTKRITNMLLFVCLITLPFVTIHGRFLGILSLLCKIYILDNFKNRLIEKKMLKLLFLTVTISTLMGIWSQRKELSISDISKLAYQSTFQIITHSYNEKWIDKNISSDGDMVKF